MPLCGWEWDAGGEQLVNPGRVTDLRAEDQSQLDFDCLELERMYVPGLLYQMGYLTIHSRNAYGLYTLDYPNLEVKNTMKAYWAEVLVR